MRGPAESGMPHVTWMHQMYQSLTSMTLQSEETVFIFVGSNVACVKSYQQHVMRASVLCNHDV